jgi:uncharacterized protein (TIGR02118 family)
VTSLEVSPPDDRGNAVILAKSINVQSLHAQIVPREPGTAKPAASNYPGGASENQAKIVFSTISYSNRKNLPSTNRIAMLKFIYCVRRHPSLSSEAFQKYWLEQHGPLVRKHAQTLRARRYVQSHTVATPLNQAAQQPRGTKAPYDGITEIWWDSPEALMAALSTAEGQEANRLLAEDEARFCDLPNCSVFFTEEHTIFDS